jgi:hypothetical protein
MKPLAVVLVALTAGVSPVLAHHSWAGFGTTSVTFEARIESVKMENPHALIELRDADQRYTVVLPAPRALDRRGLPAVLLRELLKPGDTLVVTGRLKREPEVVEVLPERLEHKTLGQIFPVRQSSTP